ncbi:MAG TPA: right-handed parallel beta-helix repeat-containing protein, partial [Herpetosiphonaceae bacterium]
MARSHRLGGSGSRNRHFAVRRICWLWMALLASLSPGAAHGGQQRQSAPAVLCDGRTLDGAAGAARLIIRDTSNVIIRNCVFRNFTRDPIVIERSSDIVIENSRFENNRTTTERRDTHGVNIPAEGQRIIIRNNVFVNNGGDGVQMGDTAAEENRGNIRDIQILNNTFTVTGDDIGENGVDIKRTHGAVLVAGNTIHGFRPCEPSQMGCTGAPGEGIVVHMGAQDVTIERNKIFDNIHGISIGDGFIPIPPRNILVRNNWISGNQGRAINISRAHSVRLVNNTLVNNARHLAISETPVSGDGVCLNSNNLFAGGPAPDAACAPQSNLYHAAAGAAAFANLAGGDFHLTAASPALNRGQSLSLVPQDFDGQPRPSGPAADIGADELPATPSDCMTATAASWKTVPLAAPQTGTFTVEGTLTPPVAATSGAFALAANTPASGAWADLAAIVLFDDLSGTIKARDGAANVDAPAPLRYQAGAAYRIRMTVNVSA